MSVSPSACEEKCGFRVNMRRLEFYAFQFSIDHRALGDRECSDGRYQ